MSDNTTTQKFAVARMAQGTVKVISGQLDSVQKAEDIRSRKADGAFIIEFKSGQPRKKRGQGLRYAANSSAIKRLG